MFYKYINWGSVILFSFPFLHIVYIKAETEYKKLAVDYSSVFFCYLQIFFTDILILSEAYLLYLEQKPMVGEL